MHQRISEVVLNNFVWLLLLLICIVAGFINPAFYYAQNIINLFIHSVVMGILVLAASVVFLTGNFDLTIEANLVFTAVVAGWLISPDVLASGWQVNTLIAIPVMLVLGIAVGFINGFLVAYVRMNPFITTLAVSIILKGITIFWSKGKTIYPMTDGFNFLGKAKLAGLPVSIIFLIALYIVIHIMLTYTPFGRKLYLVGSNRQAASASGIDVRRTILGAYMLSGLLAACAGWVLGGRLNSVSSQMSTDLLLFSFAAAVIGGISLNGGQGKVLGAFGGVLLLSSINTLMNLARINPFLIKATTGLIILLAMFIDSVKDSGFSMLQRRRSDS